MTTRLAKTINKVSGPHTVTRRAAVAWVNGRPVDNGEVAATVDLALQRVTSRPIRLQRLPDGDQTEGETRVWVTLRNLAAAEDITNPGVPLGWTELQTAPPERTEGPPGDLIDDGFGRRFEVIERLGWDESQTFTSPGVAQFQRYVVEERGATP